MRRLADYLLKVDGVEELPVSGPVIAGPGHSSSSRTDRPKRIRLGFSAQDVDVAGRLVGHDARLLTNIHSPGREVSRLRVLDVDTLMFHLLAEVSSTG